MTLAQVKSLLGITVTTYDTQMTALLPVTIAALQAELNTEFEEDESEDPIVPAGLQIVVANDIKYQVTALKQVASKKLGDYAVGYTTEQQTAWDRQRASMIKAFRVTGTW